MKIPGHGTGGLPISNVRSRVPDRIGQVSIAYLFRVSQHHRGGPLPAE